MRRAVCLFLTMLVAAGAARSQELKRRGMLGVSVALADGEPRGVVVKQVVPGSAAAEAGLEAGDRIRSVDGIEIEQPLQVSAPRRYAGETVRMTVVRGGQEITKTLVAKAKPFETRPHGEVLYRAVEVRGARRRVIITKPKRSGRFPAVLFMGGLGCYSLDTPDRTEGYGRVIDALEQKGYVTMRVEKTGEGDSEGPACKPATDLGLPRYSIPPVLRYRMASVRISNEC